MKKDFVVKNVTRELRRRVPLTGNGRGFTTVADGHESATITVFIDIEAIANQLGVKAMTSKSRTSKSLRGAIKVVASEERRRLP